MPVEGVPQLTEIWFWSGDRVFLVRDVPMMRDGIKYMRLYLVLTEQVRWRYSINDEKLNYEVSDYGVYIKEYPASHFHRLSINPEAPVVLMTCNFDGTETFGHEISDKNNEISRLHSLIISMTDENKRLAEQLKITMQRLRTLSEGKS